VDTATVLGIWLCAGLIAMLIVGITDALLADVEAQSD
jgi:hypothetical protein